MNQTITNINYETLARRFQRFAEVECRESSPLYEHLALAIATDNDVLALAAHAAQGQPLPNLFFAAVHFLLLQDQKTPLGQFYQSLTPAAASPEGAYPVFRAFCLAHAAAVQRLLTRRRVQTNEVSRCAYLFPAFALVAQLADERPLALIEIGTSAGLNLLWDRYGYRYDQEGVYGDPQAAVQIACTLRGDKRPSLPERVPAVGFGAGVDLHIIDIRDAEEALWLQALIWPEHRERARLLRHAITITKQRPPQLLAGDGLRLLPEVLHTVPDNAAVCVFHTHTINQFSVAARDRLSTLLAEYGTKRDICRIAAEWLGTSYPQLELTAWQNGQSYQRLLAYCDPHGRWLQWLDNGKSADV
jgi:hypothetical protein